MLESFLGLLAVFNMIKPYKIIILSYIVPNAMLVINKCHHEIVIYYIIITMCSKISVIIGASILLQNKKRIYNINTIHKNMLKLT